MRKTVEGFSRYWVTSCGHIINNTTGRVLKDCPNKIGYHVVLLTSDAGGRSTKSVHRLVAESFIPNPNNLPQVNHIDGDKSNNHVDNLEWCTARDNILHGVSMGLCNGRPSKAVKCLDTGMVYPSAKSASLDIDLDARAVAGAINRGWKAGGYRWAYVA